MIDKFGFYKRTKFEKLCSLIEKHETWVLPLIVVLVIIAISVVSFYDII